MRSISAKALAACLKACRDTNRMRSISAKALAACLKACPDTNRMRSISAKALAACLKACRDTNLASVGASRQCLGGSTIGVAWVESACSWPSTGGDARAYIEMRSISARALVWR